jgi:uncharacterized protein DUF1996
VRKIILGSILLAGMLVPAIPAATQQQVGSFWIRCTFSHKASDDPIVYPSRPGASHLHMFMGANDTDAYSTYDSMRNGGTSCALPQDTAGYWVPALIGPNGAVVKPYRLVAYYRGDASTVPFPRDFRAIAGNISTATIPLTPGTNDLHWSCSEEAGDMRNLATIPTDCAQYHGGFTGPLVTATIVFRNAGPNLPKLTMNVKYNIVDGTGYNLSSDAAAGTSRGRSFHADFWNTWNQSALSSLIRSCVNGLRTCGQMTSVP